MQYFGGKAKISKELSGFINSKLNSSMTFVDLFCGSCNVISKISSTRHLIANDIHPYLVALLKAVQSGVELPDTVSEAEYKAIKSSPSHYPEWLVGFVGFGLSYSGKWMGGYARNSRGDDYCRNAKNSLLKKFKTLHSVDFNCGSYESLTIPDGSLVYCDIPYKNTTNYSSGEFDHAKFYKWANTCNSNGNNILVSEYRHNLQPGWEIVWELNSKKDIRNKDGVQEATTEILISPL